MAPLSIVFSATVEGTTDEAVLRRVVEHLGATLGPVYGKTGKASLLRQLHSYNQAAQFWPWIVLVDLDQDAECAPPARAQWLPDPAARMCFRIAVREVESWLLADRETLADFLGIALSRVPTNPENLDDPKAVLVNLARSSRRPRHPGGHGATSGERPAGRAGVCVAPHRVRTRPLAPQCRHPTC